MISFTKLLVLGGVLLLSIFLYSLFRTTTPQSATISSQQEQTMSNTSSESREIASDLEVPWSIAFLPNTTFFVTERPGTLKLFSSDGKTSQPIDLSIQVHHNGEGGLLGIAIDPMFQTEKYLYLYYTYEEQGQIWNKVSRFLFDESTLSLKEEQPLLERIPGARFHNGGRIKFGPDGYLYITTGDAENPDSAQDLSSLAGKILRITKDGIAATDNPFPTSSVYSYGHRNPQGLAWDQTGALWSTEHGPSGNDELNNIIPGGNYGWPLIQGDQTATSLINPVVHSGRDTWAPAGIASSGTKLFFGGLRGSALFCFDTASSSSSKTPSIIFSQQGRIRDVVLEQENTLYVSTSNADGRGLPSQNKDKIFVLNVPGSC